MHVADRFVFLHMPKTAGGAVAEGLVRALPRGTIRGAPVPQHAGWDRIPPEARDRPVLVYVRNPWDWYVSWYHFHRAWLPEHRPDSAMWTDTFGRGELAFGDVVRRALTDGVERPEPAYTALVRDGADHYTARFLSLVGDGLDSPRLTVARYERLWDDLEAFLWEAGVTLDADTRAALRGPERVHASSHAPYASYYDDELAELVGEKCRLFVERFGYALE